MASEPVDVLLDRLQGVKQSGAGKWQARCPAHDDRSPSLSIRESDSGAVLLKCWAGCSVTDITDSVGLTLADLFPKSAEYQPGKPPRYSASEVVKTLVTEAGILAVAYRQLVKDKGEDTLTAADAARVRQALGAIDECINRVGVAR